MKHNLSNILDVGIRLFQLKGYNATGTEEILKSGNYPRSSFYYHFKNKEGFASKILERYGENSSMFYASILLNKDYGNAVDRLEQFVDVMSKMAKEKEFNTECLIQKFSSECAGVNDNLKQVTRKQLDKLIGIVSTCIAEGQTEKVIQTEDTSIDAAQRFQALLYGSFIQARLHSDANIMSKNLKNEIERLKV